MYSVRDFCWFKEQNFIICGPAYFQLYWVSPEACKFIEHYKILCLLSGVFVFSEFFILCELFFPKKYGKFACTSAYWWDSYPRHPVKTNFSWFVFHPVSTKIFWSSKCNFTVDDKEMLKSNKIYYCYIGQAVRLYKGSCKFLFKADMSQESFDFIY